MKVLVQVWEKLTGGESTSISKNREQLEETIKGVAPQKDPDDAEDILNYYEAVVPDGDPREVEIPDGSVFAEMVQSRTVFLLPDEMGVIWDSVPSPE
jgi:hypothetical protein